MMTLSEIKDEVESRAIKIGATADMLPTYNYIRGDATPCIEVSPSGYHYVISERGKEYSRDTTQDSNELLFLVFYDITFQIASHYEMTHYSEERSSRWILFLYQEELLKRLCEGWVERAHQQNERIRFRLRAMYLKWGYSSETAWEMVYRMYPLLEG